MHLTIGAIVYASDAEEAKGAADGVLENLCSESGPFDYYEIDSVYRANSRDGKNAITGLMEQTRSYFIENLQALRKALAELTDDQAFTRMGNDLRSAAYFVGLDRGAEVRLYDHHGLGVITPETLQEIFDRAPRRHSGVLEWSPGEEGAPISNDIWIVLADVHV